jgi:AcrR family transcriptional regulator
VAARPGPDGDPVPGSGGDDQPESGGHTPDPPRPQPREGGRRSAGRRIRGLEPEERRQERRRQLLDSAFHLFAAQGYARTSIEQICQGAYVGFKGFYDEFVTKEALFLVLYGEQVERITTAVAAVIPGDDLMGSGVRQLLDAFVRAVLDDRRVAQVLFIEAAGLSPAVEATRRATYRSFAEFLWAVWAGSGLVRDKLPAEGFDNHRLPLGMVGAIVELMVDWLVDPPSDHHDDEIKALVDDLEVYCRVMLSGLEATWPVGDGPPLL